MFCVSNKNRKTDAERGLLFVRSLVLILLVTLIQAVSAQDPDPTPAPVEPVLLNGFRITSSFEFGIRGKSVSGNENKYRSDLNYQNGFRVFDSSFLMENPEGTNPYLDSLLITSSGWGADPSGTTRVIAEKLGGYRFNSNVRRVEYFNTLNNFALGQHNRNTAHNMGDFDLTVFPQSEKLRLNLGYSYNKTDGPGTWTIRSSGDEFMVNTDSNNDANDFRVGVGGKWLGFNVNVGQGFRYFKDRLKYTWQGPNPGNNPVGTASIVSFLRELPVDGRSYYTNLGIQRTIAKRFDFTFRGIYSNTHTDSRVHEEVVGRDASNNQIDLDRYDTSGDAKRNQLRGDLGLTWRVTDKFTLSNTFTYDTYGIDGGIDYEQQLFRRNAAGTPLPTTLTRQEYYRITDYRRYANTIEGDYQVNGRLGFNIGYRYTNRKLDLFGYRITSTSAPSSTNPLFTGEEVDNQTHAIIGGMKFKPTKNWIVWWDVEHGTADNVFTRVANYEYTNLRLRTRMTFNKFALNASVISKDNNNPSQTFDNPPVNFGVDAKSRFYSASLDWTPDPRFSINTGYTYNHQTSETAILVVVEQPDLSRPLLRGISQYFVRDHYFNFDVSARPTDRISFFGSYRISKDLGQGDRSSALVQNIISGYPMGLQSPEFRLAIRLTKNIDWNLGYQYFNYNEDFQNAQNYHTHLPYTSLTIYFGRRAIDR